MRVVTAFLLYRVVIKNTKIEKYLNSGIIGSDVKKVIATSAKKRHLPSLAVTAMIVIAIILAGPVEAVRVNVSTDKPVYSRDDTTVTFMIGVDIERNERVPIQDLTLRINDIYKVCEFAVDGSNSCDGITITPVDQGQESTGDLQGTGEGFFTPSDDIKKRDVAYGFGYGIEEENKRAGKDAEMLYQVEWDIADVPDGKYMVAIEAHAENGDTSYTYVSRKRLFHLNFDNEKVVDGAKASIRASGGTVDYVGLLTDFDRERTTLNSELRSFTFGAQELIDGKTFLDLYAEKEDTTKIKLQVDLRGNHILTEFGPDRIEVDGEAKVDFQKTKQGIWLNTQRVGAEEPVRVQKTVQIKMIVEDNTVTVMSDDAVIPFQVTLDVDQFKFG